MGINIGASSTARILHLSNGLLRMQAGGTNNDSANTYTSGVHILVLRFDRANSSAVFYTELEALPGTYNAGASDGSKGFGSTGASADAATYLYGAMWSGTAAESFSDANVRSLLQGLGWSVSW
ncbi:MAG TPA: hypothetical protein VFT74_19075 [Isosphaeraceae bacterium]|nr:hypothetical protein [Isosphaeraceae bacterium]